MCLKDKREMFENLRSWSQGKLNMTLELGEKIQDGSLHCQLHIANHTSKARKIENSQLWLKHTCDSANALLTPHPTPLNTPNLLVRGAPRPLWRPDLEAVFEFPRHLFHATHSARSSSLSPLGFHAPIIYVCVRLINVGFMR